MRLQDKVFVVTGANGGMGKETVKRFLKEGASVAGVDLRMDGAELAGGSNLVEGSGAAGENGRDRYLPVVADLTREEDVARVFSEAMNQFGRIDGLVNIAGIAQQATPIEDVTLEAWERIMRVNATALFLTCRTVIPYFKKQRNGVIVNIASISMVRPRPGLNAYIASKGAAVSFSQALAIELAEYGIRVNVVNPGPADTEMLGQFTAAGVDVETTKDTIFKKSVPLGRLIEPADIAQSLVYLCSDEASIVTGAVLNVDGGRGI